MQTLYNRKKIHMLIKKYVKKVVAFSIVNRGTLPMPIVESLELIEGTRPTLELSKS